MSTSIHMYPLHSRRILLAEAIVLACATTPPFAAAAGVFKCIQADGRVVFSDHACANDQTGGALKASGISGNPGAVGASAASAAKLGSGGPTTSVESARQKVTRYRVHQSLTPECRTLGDRASRALQGNSNASVDEVKRAVSEFEGKCADQVVVASRKENAHGASSKSAPLDAASCQKLRQTLDADRTRLGRMTDKEKMAFAAQQNEVSIACR